MTDAGPPRRLGQRYELGDVLGLGGMAEVRRGHDVRLGRDVAVKSLRADLARDPSFQSRFRREAQAAASLNHPTIVAIYDTGDDDVDGGAPYIVMEYVDGRTLRDVLRNDGRLTAGRGLEVIREVLRALDYSHRNGIVHRDIKPANVMLTRNGAIKVMDFGISRALSDSTSAMTQTAGVLGTAQYLSPEQARGEHVDHRSDIYSTGCMLYELLTGEPPFTGDSPVAVAYQHVREDPVPPSQLVPDLPESVDAIVLKAMAKNPANRYQSATEMREDVERALAGQPVRATPVLTRPAYPSTTATTILTGGPGERDRRNGQRAAAYVALGVGVVLVFLLAAFLVRAAVDGGDDGSVVTPTLAGLTVDEARAQLSREGLRLGELRREFSVEVATGKVIRSEPLSGISLRPGDTVDLYVSDGAPPADVPDVRNDSRKDAEAAIAAAKLKLGAVTTEDGPAAAGTVLRSEPPAGTKLRQGQSVSLVVASGKNAVPDVRGRSVGEAQGLLTDAGFKVTVQEVVDESAAAGTVLGQDPQPNTVARVQSVVRIVVATVRPTPTPEPTLEPTPTPEPTQTIEPFPTP